MADVPLLQIANVLSDLKVMKPITPNQQVLLIGRDSVGDGKGGFYRWDSTDTTSAQDDTYLNVVTSSVNGATGRWVRVFQRARNTTGGVLVNIGGVKTYFTSGTTDSSGNITINLTEENTSGGTALFTNIMSIQANPQTNANGPSDAVQSYRKSLSTNLKTTTFGFYKANALTITLGLLYSPFASVGAGVPVQFRVEGV